MCIGGWFEPVADAQPSIRSEFADSGVVDSAFGCCRPRGDAPFHDSFDRVDPVETTKEQSFPVKCWPTTSGSASFPKG
jgi:hypothetical protein